MNLIFLNQVTGIWKPFAWIIGQIFNWIYSFCGLFAEDGAANIAVCLIILTIVVKLLMTPLSIKQQKYTKLQSVISPELSAIQAKYKGKTDQDSKNRMMAEQQALYEKYGTSPTAGCLPMLITLPIMIALYRVIYAIPAYVGKIYDMFYPIAAELQKITTNVSTLGYVPGDGTKTVEDIIDSLNKFTSANWTELAAEVPELSGTISTYSAQIMKINSFLGLNLIDTPLTKFPSWAILIPILAVATQYLQTWVSTKGQPKQNVDPDNAMAQSMNSMTKVMPLMSGVFCLMFANCIGIYWIVNTIVMTIQTVVINKYIDHIGLESIIAKNVEKQRIRREKMGITTSGNKTSSIANMNTKSIENTAPSKNLSISSYASSGKSKKKDNSTFYKGDVLSSSTYKNRKTEASSISDFANLLSRDEETESQNINSSDSAEINSAIEENDFVTDSEKTTNEE